MNRWSLFLGYSLLQLMLVCVANGTGVKNFQGQNLSNQDFSGQNLSKANFAGATLDSANFKNSDLSGANFSGAVVSSKLAVFDGANLTGASFAGAKFGAASFVSARLSEADFSNATIQAADFSQAAIMGASFNGAVIGGGKLTFTGTKLLKCKFVKATLHGGIFSAKETLTGCDFSSAVLMGTVFDGGNLVGIKFGQASLNKVLFRDCVLDQADFTKAVLSGVAFEQSSIGAFSLKKAIFVDAILRDVSGLADLLDNNQSVATGASFKGANFVNVSFVKTRLLDLVDFSQATFSGPATSFAGATFSAQVNFSGAKFQGSKFELKLYNADVINYRGSVFGPDRGALSLVEATVDGTNFSNAVFNWADLTRLSVTNNANFKGAQFINSKMAAADLMADFRCTKIKHSLIQYNSFEQSELEGSDIVEGPLDELTGDMGKSNVSETGLDDQARFNLLPSGATYKGMTIEAHRELCGC